MSTDGHFDSISVELSAPGGELFIFGDAVGLKRLSQTIDKLIAEASDGCFEHTHLMSPEWGGTGLSSTAQGNDTKLLHHVKLYCIKGDRAQP